MSKGRILLLTLVFIVSIIATHNYLENQPNVSTYEVSPKPGYIEHTFNRLLGIDDSGLHPIIQIINKSKNVPFGTCTAFVVTDTGALTAGHCLSFTKYDIENNKDKALSIADEKLEKLYGALTELEDNCPEIDPACSSRIAMLERLINEIESAKGILNTQDPDEFDVMDVDGNITGVTAIAFSKNYRQDYGWIEGDFKKFRKLPIRPGWHVKIGDTLRACGFYGGKMPATCTDFKALGNSGFEYAGEGVLLPGVSGGPVIDSDGYAVGIAVKALDNFVTMVPTLGIIDIYTPEQIEKLQKNK